MVSLYYSVFPPLYAHLFLCLNSWFRSPRRPLWSTPQDGGVHACLLPEVLGPRTLADAMRIAPRGSAGWRLRPRKLERQPLSFGLYSTAAREAPFPLTKGNKKSAVTPHPCCLGQWPTAPSVESVHVRLQVSASEHRINSKLTPYAHNACKICM
jgi:hypothetical protein